MSPRPYQSPLRAAHAEETRNRISSAARELFEELGFNAATVTEIARRAGVSAATVYAVYQSKAGIIEALLVDLEAAAGMDWRVPQMLDEPDPHRALRLYVAGNRAIFEHGHTVIRAVYDALGNPEVRALAQAGDASRRRATQALTRRWHRDRALRTGLGAQRASETMWLLSSPEQYLLATDVLGWSAESYERWLVELLTNAVLAPPT